jgi:hypothetical protein
VVKVAEHAGWDAVRADIQSFLSSRIQPDGTYAINNPFRYAVSAPVTA